MIFIFVRSNRFVALWYAFPFVLLTFRALLAGSGKGWKIMWGFIAFWNFAWAFLILCSAFFLTGLRDPMLFPLVALGMLPNLVLGVLSLWGYLAESDPGLARKPIPKGISTSDEY